MQKEQIIEQIKANKEVMKLIEKLRYYDIDVFYEDCMDFIQHTKDRRMFCIIRHVAKSGMSRVIDFKSPILHKDGQWGHRGFYSMMSALGYKESKSHRGFVIGGCGMDMVFNTHYTVIHQLRRFGFITKEECKRLSQMTPTVV